MIAANDQEVPATDAEEEGCKLDDEVAGIHEHRTPWYARTNSHDSWGGGNGHPYLHCLLSIFKMQGSDS